MKTTLDIPSDLQRSVISVPPLARRADNLIDREQNKRLLTHMRAGGVTTYLYGGNANLYHMAPSEFEEMLDIFAELSVEGDWFIPSVGSDFGKAMDQVNLLRSHSFPTAMVLPQRFPFTTTGVAKGLRRIADAFGRPIIAYVKDEGYIEPGDIAKLIEDGSVCAVKYAVVREKPEVDPYLEQLLSVVDPKYVVSGIGERPVIEHLTQFGLKAFTSGSVVVGPRLSTGILQALHRGDVATAARLREPFLPLEDARDTYSPIRVLHEAVRLAGICDSGPMQPFLDNITDPKILAETEAAAKSLYIANAKASEVVAV
ncbi:MAG TPA: dihydrodipicolinate synthase family protein [Candidatus Baltobacteraceae bacterium]